VQAQNVGSDVAKKAKNVTSDLSDLPNPFKGNADPSKLARDAKNQVATAPHLLNLRSCCMHALASLTLCALSQKGTDCEIFVEVQNHIYG